MIQSTCFGFSVEIEWFRKKNHNCKIFTDCGTSHFWIPWLLTTQVHWLGFTKGESSGVEVVKIVLVLVSLNLLNSKQEKKYIFLNVDLIFLEWLSFLLYFWCNSEYIILPWIIMSGNYKYWLDAAGYPRKKKHSLTQCNFNCIVEWITI